MIPFDASPREAHSDSRLAVDTDRPLELRAEDPPAVCLPPVLAHGASRRILRPQGEQVVMGSTPKSRDVLDAGEPEDRKALVRAFLHGIEIRKATRQAVLSWYRLPSLQQLSVKLVAPTGFEPVFQP
jgi:hypothetical protein